MIWFLNTFPIFRYTLPVFPIHWFICGVWLHWINMSTARLEIKTQHGCFIWMYLWRKPTVFKKVSMAFSFYLIKLRSWVELLRLQPLLWKPLVLPLSQRLLQAENQYAHLQKLLFVAQFFCFLQQLRALFILFILAEAHLFQSIRKIRLHYQSKVFEQYNF